MSEAPAAVIYKFRDFRLDADHCVLYRADAVQHVPAKVLQTLILLVQARGELLTKEQLTSALWPDTAVEEGGLARNISILRKLLDDGAAFSYIQTIPKRGYRFIGDLEILPAQSPQAVSCAEGVESDPTPRSSVSQRSMLRHGGFGRMRQAVVWGLPATAAILGVAWAAMQLHREEEPRTFSARAVTTNSHHRPISSVAISPNARSMAYVDTGQVLVRSANSNDATKVDIAPDLVVQRVDWFPDGSALLIEAFASEHGHSTVWRTSFPNGTHPKMLLQDATQARISPDGKQIAFQRDSHQLWLANVDGTDQRLVRSAPQDAWFTSSIRFSPDGSHLLTSHYEPNTGRDLITALHLETGVTTTLYESPPRTSWPTIFAKIQDFVLLPDNELLIARAMQYSEVGSELISIDTASAAARKPAVLLQWPRYFIRSISTDRTGNQLALVKDYAQADVYVANIDAARREIDQLRRLTLDDATDIPTDWSKDSSAVLFHSNRNGTFDIFRQAIDSPRAEPLVTTEENELRAIFSVDEQAVWYIASSPKDFYLTGLASLRSRSLNGTTPQVLRERRDPYLTVRCASRRPVCVLAEQLDDTSVFRAFDPTTGTDTELLRLPWQPSGFHYWALSPEGDRIAVIEPNRAHGVIHVHSLAHKHAEPLQVKVQNARTLRGIHWDPSGEGFYLTAAVGESHSSLLWVAMDGSTQVLKHHISPRGWAVPSPDGRRIAFQEWTHSGNIWSLQR